MNPNKREGKMVPIQEPLTELMLEIQRCQAARGKLSHFTNTLAEEESMLYAEYAQNGVFVESERKCEESVNDC